jgi:hypothetical protein
MLEYFLSTIRLHPDFVGMSEVMRWRHVECRLRRLDRRSNGVLAVTAKAKHAKDVETTRYRALYKACLGAFPDLFATGELGFEDVSEWE